MDSAGLRYGLAFLLGALASLAFSPTYILPLFVVAFTGLLALLERSQRPLHGLWLGWSFGFGHFAFGLFWIVESFKAHPSIPDAMGPPAVLLLAAVMALYPGLAGFLHRRLRLYGIAGLVGLAVLWSIGEWLRGHLFTGFPWNPAAAVWTASTVLMQPLALVGTYGLGFLTIMIAASPALLISRARPRRAFLAPLSGLLLVAVAALYGGLRLNRHPTEWVADVTLRIVQPNISQRDKWDRSKEREHFARYLSLSQRLGFPDGRLVIIWPETAITDYFFDREQGRRALVARMLPPGGLLLSGAPRAIEDANGDLKPANSFMAIDHQGQILDIYDKRHLVPFGEYLPLRPVLSRLGIDALAASDMDFLSGPSLKHFEIPGLPSFTPLICYEIIFPNAVTPESGPRPGFLVNVTNDAWFGSSVGPWQHLAQARMRAVEEGLPIVRAAGTGISAVIDPYGRLLRTIPLEQLGVIDSSLPAAIAVAPFQARNRSVVFPLLIILGSISVWLCRFASFGRISRPKGKREAA